jgi:hypothetical protein
MTTAKGSTHDGQTPVSYEIPRIQDGEALIRYAVAAQLEHLPKSVSLRKLGSVLSRDATNLNHGLSGRINFTSTVLKELDEAIDTATTDHDHAVGLAQFAVRMRGLQNRESLNASIPPAWTAGERGEDGEFATDELHILADASTQLRHFLTAQKLGIGSERVRSDARKKITGLVDRLILIAGAPPTPRNVEAQILLGSLARFAFEITLERLEASLRGSPLGFRTWRSLTKLMLLSRNERDAFIDGGLRARLSALMSEANRMRAKSIYPGRSLDLELAISVPPGWLGANFVTKMLMARAQDPGVTLRERATAAHGLWERAVEHHQQNEPHFQEQMGALLRSFKESEADRPDIVNGLRWAVTTIEHVMHRNIPVCNDWPKVDEPWIEPITEAADLLEQDNLPDRIRVGTRQLFLHILLQNAGVQRRKAIDTLTAGGWVEPVVRALASVLRDERTEGWIRVRGVFALGFMQHRSATSTQALITACQEAYQRVIQAPEPSKSDINELHAAIFAIGDAFGALGGEKQARAVRDELEPVLTSLVEDGRLHQPGMHQVARAIVYTLTFTAQHRTGAEQEDLAQRLLKLLATHPDDVTARFSAWALRFRFGPEGEIRPILFAAG